jgi:hypothetical protein
MRGVVSGCGVAAYSWDGLMHASPCLWPRHCAASCVLGTDLKPGWSPANERRGAAATTPLCARLREPGRHASHHTDTGNDAGWNTHEHTTGWRV